MMTNLTRRQLFIVSLAAGLVAASRSEAQSPLKKLTISLDWTPNTNHIGLYVARENGLYTAAGLDVQILPYGNTGSGTLIANRVADFGVIGSVGFFTQKAAGADLKAVYGVVQSETGRLVFDASRADINSPKNLDGLKYGGFGSAWENALIGTMIRHDGGKGSFQTITLGTAAYDALASGAVDFTLEVSTWEGVEAELKGLKQRAIRYADYGVPDQQTTLIASSDAYLSANSNIAGAFVKATQLGYGYAADHPDEAADLLVHANADFPIDRALVLASLQALIDGHYLRGSDGDLGLLNSDKINAMGNFLFASGILKDDQGNTLKSRPNFSAYFTNAYFLSRQNGRAASAPRS
jgi:ABC-type nitrate/sulfonate/bicarbonate transport system substrate-binding protein